MNDNEIEIPSEIANDPNAIINFYKNQLNQGFILADNDTRNNIIETCSNMLKSNISPDEVLKYIHDTASSDANKLKNEHVQLLNVLNSDNIKVEHKLIKLKDILDAANERLKNG